MLISKGFTQGDVVSLKLVNGDEIIARFESQTTDSVTINRPLALTMSNNGLGMIPWCFLGEDDKITINKSNTFFIVASKADAAKQYLEGTTGLTL